MLTELNLITLKSGEKMRVCLLRPPADDLLDNMKALFEHYPEQPRRDIFQRFRGDYSLTCDDFYFVGIIDGQVAGVVWYGYAKDFRDIANFGNVYTVPAHRKKNITNILMEYFAEHFKTSVAKAVFCTCSNPWIVSIYAKHGFKPVLPGTEVGFLMLENKGVSTDFVRFTDNYYALTPGVNLTIVPGDIRQRHPIDTTFYFYKCLYPELFKPRIGISSIVWNYQYALHRVEDGKGKLFTAVTDDKRVMGWAFCLNPASHLEQSIGILDYEIHPEYNDFAPALIRETARASKDCFATINAQIPSFDTDKTKAFVAAGFRPAGKFADYGKFANSFFDLDNFQLIS